MNKPRMKRALSERIHLVYMDFQGVLDDLRDVCDEVDKLELTVREGSGRTLYEGAVGASDPESKVRVFVNELDELLMPKINRRMPDCHICKDTFFISKNERCPECWPTRVAPPT